MPENKEDATVEQEPQATEPEPSTQEALDPKKILETLDEEKLAEIARESKVYKGLQRTVSQKERELEAARAEAARVAELEAKLQELTMQSELMGSLGNYGELDADAKKEIEARIKRTVATVAQQQALRKQMEESQKKINEVKSVIEDAGLDPNSEEFAEAEYFASVGRYDLAKKKAKEVIAKVKPEQKESQEKKETEDERVERLVRERMEKAGLLEATGTTPSGSSRTFTRAQIASMSDEEYRKNRDAIDAAMREGRIK